MNFDNLKQQREKLGLNQHDFWARVKVTQSGGSRYENSRNIPEPVQQLLTIAYGTQKEADAITKKLRPPASDLL